MSDNNNNKKGKISGVCENFSYFFVCERLPFDIWLQSSPVRHVDDEIDIVQEL